MRNVTLLACLLVAGCQTAAGNPPAATSALSDAELFGKARTALLAQLKDPDSAKITDMRRVPSSSGDYVCGRVNGKNSFGAYAGAEAFSVAPNGATSIGGNETALFATFASPCWAALHNG